MFPGGKDELLRDTVAWEMGRFFGRLRRGGGRRPTSRRSSSGRSRSPTQRCSRHEVLQKVLVTEPERLLPLITVEQDRVLEFITAFFLPFLARDQAAGRIRPGVDLEACAEYVARMVLSLVGSPGRHDLDDPEQVRRLVRDELLGGVLT